MKQTKTPHKKLVLLDVHAIIHRAYHALPDFSTSKGEPSGALYGLCAMLIKIIDELQPDYIAACYDLPAPTHRHELFKEYKGGRAKTDDELVAQIIRSRDIFNAFAIPMYDREGYEADDVLGTIVDQTKNKKTLDVVIASGDMDTLQLVQKKKVQVYTLKKGINDTIIYDESAVQHRFGFGPERIVDYKGLRGDPSDNIPGIRGIGEKTATTLITTFGSIEKIYTTLKRGSGPFEKAGITKRIIGLLTEGEEEAYFSKMLATIHRDVPIKYKIPKHSWPEEVDTKVVLGLFDELEFRTLAARLRTLLGVVDHLNERSLTKNESIDETEKALATIALWLVRSDTTNPSLEDLFAFTGEQTFKNAQKSIFATLKERKLESVYTDIEKPLLPVVEKMNEVGVLLDTAYLKKLSRAYHKDLVALQKKIYIEAGETFNINSPKQLSHVLFDVLGLKPKNQKKTATGQRSTKESELEKLRDEHPIIKNILAQRELQKLLSTYIDTMPDMVDENNRLHTEFIQTGTTTGRIASQNPNVQNIPVKTDQGRAVRDAFIARKGCSLMALDYSQIELRIAAIVSKDKRLIEVFKNDEDIHKAVAAAVFKTEPTGVTGEMRRRAKVINFGILYGMGVNALRTNLGTDTTQGEARAYLEDYFASFSGLAGWIDTTKADAARLGYTTTLFGRRRYFEGINSHLPFIRASAERMAINAPIQGTQADIIKIAMVRIDEYLKKETLLNDVQLVLQVHDELIYEVKDTLIEKTSKVIQKIMEEVLTPEQASGVPIRADIKVGKDWGHLKAMSD